VELRAKRAGALLAALLAALAALLVTIAALPASAGAASDLERPASQTEPPALFDLSAATAIRIAGRTPEVRQQKQRHPSLEPVAYYRPAGRWQVGWYADGRERAQVHIHDASGAVTEAWTGHQVAWRMARGYEGAFGRKVNAPWIWLPLCALFLAPFVSVRRPFRLLHLDLAVLLAFGISHIWFNRGEIGVSVPLAYPVLGYLLVRMLVAGFRRTRERDEPLVPHIPLAWLAIALLFLVGFRIGLNITESNVIDVGYAGVIGADRIVDGDPLYEGGFADSNAHGDTYGPFNYLAYVPFEQALSWTGLWDDLWAAHAAAIAFDLLTLLGLWVLGRKLRGDALGIALAYAWAAFPYTLFSLNTNANDTLVAMLVVWALVALRSPPLRGALVGLAAAAKFAPLALAPLLAGAGPRRWRGAAVFTLALLAALALTFAPFLPDGGPREVYDRTIGYQAGRDSPFSVWGLEPSLGWLHTPVKVAAVALALLVAFVPRHKDTRQVAALGAAVLIGLQLAVEHWFYLYVVWFAPLVLAALFTPYRGPEATRPGSPPAAEPHEQLASVPA
jgi:Glycosyltransferase family 87